jgi:hypothetical protein
MANWTYDLSELNTYHRYILYVLYNVEYMCYNAN